MYVFRSMADLQSIPPNHPCQGFVLELVRNMIHGASRYNPDDDGYAVLIEPQDLSLAALLPETTLPLSQIPWEGVMNGHGLYHGVILTNNQFAIDVVIPDAEWLSADVRKSLEAQL